LSDLKWDVAQYERFREERERPFRDLIARVPQGRFARIADLGCGTGTLTRTLLERWPKAQVWGVDSSAEMLHRALSAPLPPNLHFIQADLNLWKPAMKMDFIVSNAAIHWVPDHARLLESLVDLLAPSGVLAVQIPNNRGEAAYSALESLLAEPEWTASRGGQLRSVESTAFYEKRLRSLGLEPVVWETVYQHRFDESDDIVEWLKGTTLRPILSNLPPAEAARFIEALGPRMSAAYPRGEAGVVFPFRRLFFVATRGTIQLS
jgi:trans-aconitate 2-methyltransferase